MTYRKFGPKSAAHPGVDKKCPGCKTSIEAGDFTTLVVIGPGSDPESQERARTGRPYNAVAIEAHWTCVTGEPTD